MFPLPNPTPQTPHHKPVFTLFGSRAVCAYRRVFLMLVALTLLPAAGCSWGQSKKDSSQSPQSRTAEDGRAVFSDRYDEDGDLAIPSADANESTQWSIILAVLESPAQAQQALNVIQSTHGLIGAYTAQRAEKTVVAYGKYDSPDDSRAKIDLDRIREQQSGSSRPFAGAYLAPPATNALVGSNAEFDLRTVKDRFGPSARYTLQLGVYGRGDGQTPNPSEIKEFRQIAERSVLELRSNGERAFYYHAPFRSMVTIGVFGEADFDASTTPPIESMQLRELRKRYPHNYLNGQGISETIMTETGQRVTRLQASSLVAIPDK